MNIRSIIELHDSTIAGIEMAGDSIVVRFRQAYIHRSKGRPGFDAGTGWVQDVDLIVRNSVMESGFSELPCDLLNGSCSIDGIVYSNAIPLLLDATGEIKISFESGNGEKLIINAFRISVVALGEVYYIEDFPGIT